jgi:MFS family permease
MEFMWALAGGIGPLLGGAFSQYVSWRWSFWVNLPVCGLAFVLLLLFLDVHNPKTKMLDGVRAIDWFGSLSILGLTLMLLLGLDFGGETFPWDSPKVICLIVFGSLCSLLFIYSEKRLAKYPLMPMSLFAQTSNIATLAVTFAHGFVRISHLLFKAELTRSRFLSLANTTSLYTYNLSKRPHPYALVSSFCP